MRGSSYRLVQVFTPQLTAQAPHPTFCVISATRIQSSNPVVQSSRPVLARSSAPIMSEDCPLYPGRHTLTHASKSARDSLSVELHLLNSVLTPALAQHIIRSPPLRSACNHGNIGPQVSTCRLASTRTCALLSPNFVPMTLSRPRSQSRCCCGTVSALAAT